MYNVDIIQFDKDFNFISNLIANEVFIENKNWLIKDAQLTNFYGKHVNIKDYNFKTNLNYNDVNSLFSNLSSLNIFELNELRKNMTALTTRPLT